MTENHEIGEKVRGNEIGRGNAYTKFIWVRCPDCHEERWAHYSEIKNTTLRMCKYCAIDNAKKNFYVGGGLDHKPTHKKKVE
jgi:ribosomal protein S27E